MIPTLGAGIRNRFGGAKVSERASALDERDGHQVVVVTFGTFDLIHVGHIRLLERARKLGTTLVVGVSTDALSISKKGRRPVQREAERIEVVQSIRYVDRVFLERSLEEKESYLRTQNANVLVMGDDWKGVFDDLSPICDVVYLPRTPSVSTTATIEQITLGELEVGP
jgi:glycerol-3-phosphate cytidylyltransferase